LGAVRQFARMRLAGREELRGDVVPEQSLLIVQRDARQADAACVLKHRRALTRVLPPGAAGLTGRWDHRVEQDQHPDRDAGREDRGGERAHRLGDQDRARQVADRGERPIGVCVQARSVVIGRQVDGNGPVAERLELRHDPMPVPGRTSRPGDQDEVGHGGFESGPGRETHRGGPGCSTQARHIVGPTTNGHRGAPRSPEFGTSGNARPGSPGFRPLDRRWLPVRANGRAAAPERPPEPRRRRTTDRVPAPSQCPA
jgi:hypothetical protein